jgi:rubrerythrin
MATTKQEIIEAAIQLERDGREFYMGVAGKSSSDLARQMFESLADDELIHIEWIEKMLSPDEEVATATKKRTYERLSGIFADVPDSVRQGAASSEDDVEAINTAIKMEEKSRAAYLKWADETGSDELRKLCNALADQERFHREILENTIQYLESTGDWFMAEEGWHFDGG